MPLNDDSRPTTPPQGLPQSSTSAQTQNSTQKTDQIAHRFFIKFLLIIAASRSTAAPEGPRSSKVDKWFNIETPDTDIHRDHMRAFRTISALNSLPSLTLHCVLLIPELGTRRALVAVDAPDAPLGIEPTPRAVLLETWTLTASPSSGSSSSGSLSSSESDQVSLAAVYKHAISLFRSLYTLCRQLPAAKLFQRYRQRAGVPPAQQAFGIELRLHLDNSVLTFDASPSPSRPIPLPTSTHAFPALSTPLGSLKIVVRYLSRPNFRVDTLESIISDRLFNQDAGRMDESIAFTPTVLAHRQRDSATGSGAMAIRGSKIPPQSGQRHTRTISFPAPSGSTAPSQRPQQDRGVSGSGSGSVSDYDHSARLVPNTGSPRVAQFRSEALAFATSSSLGRGTPVRGRESLDAGRATSGTGGERSSPGTSYSPPSAINAPRPPVISAFRSSTLVPSGVNSPSTSLRSLGLGTPGITRPPSSLPHAIPEASGGPSTKPWPTASSSPQSGGLAFPSNEPPPFASTSVPKSGVSPLAALLSGTPRSGDSTSSGGIVTKNAGKRYSSSFGHRRAPSAGGSGTPGSTTAAGSVELAARRYSSAKPGGSPAGLLADLPSESPRPSNILLEPTENEENLSEFIREIDNARLRHSSNARMSESHSSSSVSSSGVVPRRVSLAERRQSPLIGRLELPPPPSPRSPPSRLRELNLTDPDANDDEVGNTAATTGGRLGVQITSNPTALGMQLQNMDDQFKKTLQGLKDRRRISAPPTQAQPSPSREGREMITGDAEAGPADSTRRPVPSFRSGAVRERDQAETEHVSTYAATPGDGTGSDGSGYAGVVGRLDLDSPELRTQGHTHGLPGSPGFPRQAHQLQQQIEASYGAPSGSPTGAVRNISREREAGGSPRRSEDEGSRYEGDSEGTRARAERSSKYTSMLRRDATLRADPSRQSSGSTTTTDSSRTRRAATGWTGVSSPTSQ